MHCILKHLILPDTTIFACSLSYQTSRSIGPTIFEFTSWLCLMSDLHKAPFSSAWNVSL